MKKSIVFAFSVIVLAIAVLSVSTVTYFRAEAVPEQIEPLESDFLIPEPAIEEKKEYSIPPIKSKTEVAGVIEDVSVTNPEDEVPPPEVNEVTESDGSIVQTPNWEAQKQLAPDTNLEDPDKIPEYVKPETTKSSTNNEHVANDNETAKSATDESKAVNPDTNNNISPKNGDTKTFDGATYTFVEGFGWVKNGDGGTTEYIDAPTTGNKVGY